MSKQYSIEEALKDLGKDIEDLSEEMVAKAKSQVQVLAASAHSMIVQKATAKLHSTRSTYIDALNIEKIDSSPNNEIWAVTLNESAKWIEEGQPKHNMIDYLVNGPKSKVSKEGHRYNVIPFQHNKPNSEMSAAQNKLASYVKTELKRRGLDKVITKDGKPVLGRAATVDLIDRGSPQSEKTFRPLLQGLTIYQREVKTKSGKTQIKRDIMTFRVASEKQKGTGAWDNPGRAPMNFFEETARELDVIWEKMLEEIVK